MDEALNGVNGEMNLPTPNEVKTEIEKLCAIKSVGLMIKESVAATEATEMNAVRENERTMKQKPLNTFLERFKFWK